MTLETLEERLGRLLGIGTAISSGLLAMGLLLYLVRGGQSDVFTVLNVGLMALIATPLARVVASAVGFAAQRDWRMFGMTLLVLTSLTLSFVFAVG